ncbi:hypothetical protein TRV_00094 [Trichophyton verrucosum HKI 0517]|uniref:Hydrophobin n=1 Tax=Trichophyton verrucosum (strain HKI 0517) TaxID=663202 RepID=D4CZ57_TRIVH|nr:uncharacterized protein TRV_00094 [Trichophyton verrucosum HKI 0517]EFE45112.1 hypothetical protein TRV_00094 [Trichophyton verrucosum HKI 0517]
MQLTQVLAVAILAAGVSAGHRPHRPHSNKLEIQDIKCQSGAPYCCSPEKTKGSTCTKLTGSSVNCDSVVVCCNNNGDKHSPQTCSASVAHPITFVDVDAKFRIDHNKVSHNRVNAKQRRDDKKDYGKNDYGKNDYGKNDYGKKDYGKKDYGKKEYDPKDHKDYGYKDYGHKDYGHKDYGHKDYGHDDYGYKGYDDKEYGYRGYDDYY